MSIKTHINSFSQETLDEISKDLQLMIKKPSFNTFGRDEFFDVYSVDGDNLYLPLAYTVNKLKLQPPPSSTFPKINNNTYVGTLRDHQILVKDEAIKNLNTHKATLISGYPGFGKTRTSIYIASKIGLKTLIIVNKIPLMDQWKKSILDCCPDVNVKLLTTGQIVDEEDDYVIVNAINIPKFNNFTRFGTLIIDECHLIMSKVLSQSIFRIQPRYVIGLSATPYRPDGLDGLINLVFTDKKIVRKLYCPHIVYKIETTIVPEVESGSNGKLNWNKVIDSLCLNDNRNRLIVDIIKKYNDRIFMVLTKRVEQGRWICRELEKTGENVSLLVGNEKDYDVGSRILIGTIGKIGVGFDHSKINALFLASDVEEYFIQYLGRTMRIDPSSKDFIKPLIFDIVDNFSVLKKHFATRKKTYIEAGGEIIKYK